MNNTIPFHSAPHAPQITVDVNILTMLKQAASCLSEAAGKDVYLVAIGPDMELTIIMEENALSVLPCFDEEDALMKNKIIGVCPNCGANVVEREKGWFCE